MNIIAIFLGLVSFYVVYSEGYCSVFNRKAFFESHKRYKEIYSHVFFIKWWFDLLDKYPALEIIIGLATSIIFLVAGILFIFVGFFGPIRGSWDFHFQP